MLLDKKKDRQLHICIDHHTLNKSTISDSYTLLGIEELLSHLKGPQCYSCLDFRDAYFHVPIAKEDVYKMAFSYRFGTFEYLVLPFGLMHATDVL